MEQSSCHRLGSAGGRQGGRGSLALCRAVRGPDQRRHADHALGSSLGCVGDDTGEVALRGRLRTWNFTLQTKGVTEGELQSDPTVQEGERWHPGGLTGGARDRRLSGGSQEGSVR